ncbi:hypothetical protein IMG5_184350 [Ichthyophthirius multifiliis]|uniref:Ankyrin repeat protein n=1 Tax=Ichthyophthirius multifiliis TaxID=5932 RepID=G0R3B4_ICHMU|nr:hypothetical protein IMG5_184350 [Ichthyophthirius multifiliis]EGR28033.1 hypothetical protein IMG5_184350 [Ichthyophthirius multifiliis]|eukprot:XP_004027378.1 hypothetical protein IMG5_184350 [Ichthyophthirius multifiliis]
MDKTIDMLDQICQTNKKQFDYIMEIGNKISYLSKNEELEQLEILINQNSDVLPLLRGHIQEAFESILHLRFDEVIEFFLENGYQINQQENNYLIDLCKTSRFFAVDPPKETLNLLIKYGVDLNQMEDIKYRTALHYACKYGIIDFVKILVQNGAEIDPVDFKKRTPYDYAQKKNNQKTLALNKFVIFSKIKDLLINGILILKVKYFRENKLFSINKITYNFSIQ